MGELGKCVDERAIPEIAVPEMSVPRLAMHEQAVGVRRAGRAGVVSDNMQRGMMCSSSAPSAGSEQNTKPNVQRPKKRKPKRKHMPQNTHDYALAQLVCALVSIEFGVTFKVLMAPTKGRAHQSFARQVAMYLMHVVFQTRFCGVAAAFGRDQSTVSYACRLIEDERDDQVFDERLQKMEDFLNSAKSLKSVHLA